MNSTSLARSMVKPVTAALVTVLIASGCSVFRGGNAAQPDDGAVENPLIPKKAENSFFRNDEDPVVYTGRLVTAIEDLAIEPCRAGPLSRLTGGSPIPVPLICV